MSATAAAAVVHSHGTHVPATLALYRSMLRTSRLFSDYNFREYALRRTRDAFRAHRDAADPRAVETFLNEAESQLALLKRQTTISQMYQSQKLVVETPRRHVVAHH
ncbi:uncharacterized protein V1518DRAFT_407107 [Limtongia smithiae]|uniref:uncharacterized protein n=1 Tax=Limtongia smithiae TaxID=1125753 RepID=UPI0034CD5C41